MIKAFVFDGDGVVLLGPSFSKRYIKKYKISFDVMKPFFDNEFQLCVIGKLDLKKALKNYLQSWKWQGSIEELIHFWLSNDVINYELLEEVKNLKTRGIHCYLGSNQEKYRAYYIINGLGLKKNFKKLYFSCFLNAKKPDGNFYEKIYFSLRKERDDIKKDEVIFIDDDEQVVNRANRLGFRLKQYTTFKEIKEWLDKQIQT